MKGSDALKDMLVHVKTSLYNGSKLKQKCVVAEEKLKIELGAKEKVSKAMF